MFETRAMQESFSQTKKYKVRIRDLMNKISFNSVMDDLDFARTDLVGCPLPRLVTFEETKDKTTYITRALQISISQQTQSGCALAVTIYRVKPKVVK